MGGGGNWGWKSVKCVRVLDKGKCSCDQNA